MQEETHVCVCISLRAAGTRCTSGPFSEEFSGRVLYNSLIPSPSDAPHTVSTHLQPSAYNQLLPSL